MFHPPRPRWAPADRARLQIDITTPCVTVALPRGRTDVRFRITSYPNGSRALELQDAEGRPFYVPTMPVDLGEMQRLVPADQVDEILLGIKPSAIRNGMAAALVEAGLLVDLGIEMPVDRHFVHLMRFDRAAAGAQDAREAEMAAAAVPAPLARPKIPPEWKPGCRRIQAVFRRRGLVISEEDAFLAWILSGRVLPTLPPRLPASADALFMLLKDRFGGSEAQRQAEHKPDHQHHRPDRQHDHGEGRHQDEHFAQ